MAKEFNPFDIDSIVVKGSTSELVKVDSSNILYIGYDDSKKVMTVIFHDFKGNPTGAYQYKNVPKNVYTSVKNGRLEAKGDGHKPSVGGTFCKLIKNHQDKYPYKPIDLNKALRSNGQSLI